MTSDIQSLTNEYIAVDDEISEINNRLKELRNSKKTLEEQILEYMKNSDINRININDGCIKISITKPPSKKINKKDLLPVLIDNNINDKSVASILETVFEEQTEPEEKTKLVRSKK
jgi:septal ring factor EnvC (AmiA/AmiB activator)